MRSLPLSLLLAAASIATATPSLGQELVARYGFDEPAGFEFTDLSFNDQDGTWVNGASVGLSGIVGKSAAVQPSQSQYGMLTASTELDALRIDLTVSAWVLPATLGGTRRIFGNDGSWSFGVVGNKLRFTTRGIKDYDIDSTLSPGVWSHIVAVFDENADVTFYLNGTLVGVVDGDLASNAPDPEWYIGALRPDFQLWDGRIDDIQVYDAALDAAQVSGICLEPGTSLEDVGMRYCVAADNSTGSPAEINAIGSDVVSQNSVRLVASNLPVSSYSFFMASQSPGFVVQPSGSAGNLCLSGAIGRYVGPGNIQQAGPGQVISLAIALDQIPDPQLGLVAALPGETWHFQAWYRDSVSGVATSNFTDAIEITFQ